MLKTLEPIWTLFSPKLLTINLDRLKQIQLTFSLQFNWEIKLTESNKNQVVKTLSFKLILIDWRKNWGIAGCGRRNVVEEKCNSSVYLENKNRAGTHFKLVLTWNLTPNKWIEARIIATSIYEQQ